MSTGRQAQAEHESKDVAEPSDRTENPIAGEKEEVSSGEPIETAPEDEEQVSVGNAAGEETSTSAHLSCLTVQPNSLPCGVREEKVCILHQANQ